jgi:branched-chain amino acid transport system ATP-binding protein
MKTVLRIDNLFKGFSGLQVLAGVTMEVCEGERHMVIGPNGAGKTTLFNVITGMYRPTSGKIHFLEENITGYPAYRIARLGLCRSFQVINVFPKMTVYENVRNGIVSKANKRFRCVGLLHRDKDIARQTEGTMELFALKDVRDVLASELSYGRQRHLELALTMTRDPVLIMLDEPTAGLNSEESRSAVQLIRQITEGKTLLMVEHDMDVVFNLADRITVLANGTVLAVGAPGEIRRNEEVKRAYLGKK